MGCLYEDLGTLALDAQAQELNSRLVDFSKKSYPRTLVAVALSGGSTAGDSAISITAGDYVLCKVYNTSTDEIITKDDIVGVSAFIPANKLVTITCIDAFPADCHIYLYTKRAK
jgi:hypothetical protein